MLNTWVRCCKRQPLCWTRMLGLLQAQLCCQPTQQAVPLFFNLLCSLGQALFSRERQRKKQKRQVCMHVYIGMGNITSLPFALGHNSSKYSGDSFGYSCSIVRKVLHRLHPSKNVFPTAQLVGDDSNYRGIWKFQCQFLMLLRSAYVAHTGQIPALSLAVQQEETPEEMFRSKVKNILRDQKAKAIKTFNSQCHGKQ